MKHKVFSEIYCRGLERKLDKCTKLINEAQRLLEEARSLVDEAEAKLVQAILLRFDVEKEENKKGGEG